jgi:1,2-dihydroxy-3-keto-5-methylthiopentene dioxygenase
MYLVIRDAAGAARSRHEGHDEVARAAAPLGLRVGRIRVGPAGREARTVAADAAELGQLHRVFGVRSADRVRVAPGDGRWPLLRSRFRQRHTHTDHELRVFVRGQGLFELALQEGGRAQLLVEAGEWLALPPHTPHAFDAGAVPDFDALRLFTSDQGWVSTPTPDAPCAPRPDLDRLLAERALLSRAAA